MDKRALLIWMALTPLVGCTSLPFVLEKELPASMDAMLVEDRKQISQLQQRVLAQDTADTLRLFSNALQEFLTVREVAEEAEVLWGDEEEESAEAEDAEPVPGDVAAAVEKDATPAR